MQSEKNTCWVCSENLQVGVNAFSKRSWLCSTCNNERGKMNFTNTAGKKRYEECTNCKDRNYILMEDGKCFPCGMNWKRSDF
ncbi:hypothetical protein pv_246 [Pithovirus sibericum]|uniref:Uncharacterized protein n=1 Tax=Pithovirus sibericum TaxID=1450746 RepID=W5S4X2_9VIRU|nr:hypothetical protein pv_246 [Pithovirus sibericum]AHH01813.1 hypothetical protein pv_246 [Pithovirus sibericum]